MFLFDQLLPVYQESVGTQRKTLQGVEVKVDHHQPLHIEEG